MGKPRNTRKYPRYPEIPESKKGTRKYLIVFSDTPTRPESDPLPGILSNTRPDPTRPDIEKPYPLGTASHMYAASKSKAKIGTKRSTRSRLFVFLRRLVLPGHSQLTV